MTGSALQSIRPYRTRPIRFDRLHRQDGIALKVYTIAVTTSAPPAQAAIEAAIAKATDYLAHPKTATIAGVDWWGLPTYGVGSLIVHRGREAIFALLDWWVDENMLRHQVWVARTEAATEFESLAPADLAMCVWELAVIQHEREAWLRHIYTPDRQRSLDGYLADVLNADL